MRSQIGTGILGLDNLLHGGLPQGSVAIVEGAPGTGKTTLGLQFLYSGATIYQESGLYITFEELPNQIYADALSFGWDLRELERVNSLRVICISPELFLQEIEKSGGLIEKLIQDIHCKRMVIDSISLLGECVAEENSLRSRIYSIRNILRKHKITTLMLREQSYFQPMEVPFENFVMDGVIRLNLQPLMEKYRKRTLEVLKMRGTQIVEGEHNFRILDKGIHLIPLFAAVEDKGLMKRETYLSTGISALDDLLSGGMPRGSVFILDTNSKANYQFILGSIFAERLRQGDRTVVLMPGHSTIQSFNELIELYRVSLEEAVTEGKMIMIDHYDRHIPENFRDAVISVSDVRNKMFNQVLKDKLSPLMKDRVTNEEEWFFYYDLTALFSNRGNKFGMKFFAREAARARALGYTVLALCNFSEINREMASFLERTGNGVLRTWVDAGYQYLQVSKSPNGMMSAPMMIESISEDPFIRLL